MATSSTNYCQTQRKKKHLKKGFYPLNKQPIHIDMHIVQLLPELNQGGVERGTVELNRELVKRGHTSTVISNGGEQAGMIEQDGGHHHTLNICSKNPLTFFQRSQQLRNYLSEIKPDILHARSRVPAWLAWQANKKLQLPFITTVHGFNSVNPYSAIMTKGDLVIYGSTAIKEHILQHYTINPDKLRYVPRGIDTDFFDPEKADQEWINTFKSEHNLNGRKIVTTVGRITEWKGQDDFIKAIAQVQKTQPEVLGLIVGGVWHDKKAYFESLQQLAQKLKADIRFVGSQTNVREIYALSDVVVSAASTKPETFGRVAAEALAMNTPVVASAHGGSLDIIPKASHYLLYAPRDHNALAKNIATALVNDLPYFRNHVIEKFSLMVNTDTTLNIYKDFL